MTDSMPLLRAGESAGPFEIKIPRGTWFLIVFRCKTTRWERFRLEHKLMRRSSRRALWECMRPWFDEYGWHE